MNIKTPYYYKNFKCIGSACTDTCCAGWEVVIDDNSYHYYKTVAGEFGNRLEADMILSEDEHCFVLKDGNCPFLNEHKLCDIYTELGEDKLCETCKSFPRFSEEFGDLREIGISLSCPEAARLILSDSSPVIFETVQTNELLTTYNDIDYELYMQLTSSRNLAIKILQDRSILLSDRIALLLSFSHDIQETIDQDQISYIANIKDTYSQDTFKNKFIKDLDRFRSGAFLKQPVMASYLEVFMTLENINNSWPKTISHALDCLHGTSADNQFYQKQYADFDAYYQDMMYEYEHLMVYFVFRYFMKAVYDEDVFSKVKLAVVSFLIIRELDVVQWIDNGYLFDKTAQIDVMHLYSKETEHSDANLDALEALFQTNTLFNLESLITGLIG